MVMRAKADESSEIVRPDEQKRWWVFPQFSFGEDMLCNQTQDVPKASKLFGVSVDKNLWHKIQIWCPLSPPRLGNCHGQFRGGRLTGRREARASLEIVPGSLVTRSAIHWHLSKPLLLGGVSHSGEEQCFALARTRDSLDNLEKKSGTFCGCQVNIVRDPFRLGLKGIHENTTFV